MEQKNSLKICGILKGIDTTEAPDKSWKKASLKVEVNGKINTISTFDSNDINLAIEGMDKIIEAEYTTKATGTTVYKNIIKGTLKIKNDNNNNIEYKTENIEDEKCQHSTNAYKPSVPMINPEKQRSIVRQNSWTQALNYIDKLILAKQNGIDIKLDKEDLKLDKIKALAHTIEEDIFRE